MARRFKWLKLARQRLVAESQETKLSKKKVSRIPYSYGLLFFATIFMLISLGFVAFAATNVISSPEVSANPPGISPQTADGFNDTTTISYNLASSAYSNLRIYSNSSSTTPLKDLLTSASQTAGTQSISWDGKDNSGSFLPSDPGYKSKYDGISFREVLTSGGSLSPAQIDIDTSTNPYTIYLADNSGVNRLFKSNDYGKTWVKLGGTGLPANNITGVAVFNTGANPPSGYTIADGGPGPNVTRIYVVVSNSRLYWSDDGGANFSNSNLKAGAVLTQADTDTNGTIYITNIDGTPPHRVMKRFYDPGLPGWVNAGSPNAFINPRGIAVVGTGTIYVADSSTSAASPNPGRIWKSSDGGNTYNELILGGSSDDRIGNGPFSIYYQNENNTLWISDTGNNRVKQFWPDGKWIQTLQGAGSYNLSTPRAVAIGPDKNLYVGETGNTRVQRFVADNIWGQGVIAVDNDPPESGSVSSISSPAGTGIYHKGIMSISADAFDSGSGINRVEFYRTTDVLPINIDYSGADGWNCTWDTSLGLDEGNHGIYVKVYDGALNPKTSSIVQIEVDNTLPSASITAPTAGSFKKAIVSLVGTANDSNIQNYSVEYFDGADWQEIANSTNGKVNETLASWDTTGKNGSYTVRLSVNDKADNSSTTNVTFTVDNTVPDSVTTSNASNDPFSPVVSPGIKDDTTVALTANDNNGLDGTTSWTLVFKNQANAVVRTYSGTGSPASQVWNGTYDDDVTPVPDGQYNFVYEVTDKAGNKTATAPKYVEVDNTIPAATIGSPSTDPFSPNADGVKDTTNLGIISASDSNAISSWDIKIYDKDDLVTPVRTISGAGNPNGNNEVWDGKDDSSTVVSDDIYKYKLSVTDEAGNTFTTALNQVVVDNSAPTASVSVASNDPFSPNADGIKDTTSIDLSSSDSSGIASYELVIHDIDTKTFSGAGNPDGTTKVWSGDKDGGGGAPDGTYTYELKVTDNAGNQFTSASKTVYIDNTAPNTTADAAIPNTFSPKQDGSVTTSINVSATDVLPATLDPNNTQWTLTIKNSSNITVREYTGTTLSASIIWNGKADDNPATEPVPGGTYKYTYSAVDKAGNKGTSPYEFVTVDRTGPTVLIGNPTPSTFSPNGDASGDTTDIGPMTASDPSGVASWKVEFRLSGTTAISRTISGVGDPSGSNVTWDGKDDGGSYVSDGVYEYIFKAYDSGGNEGAAAPKTVTADTIAPVIADDQADPTHFSPNSDGVNEKVRINANISDASSINWLLTIKNEFAAPVVVQPGSGVVVNYEWDGKVGGVVQGNGAYSYEIQATDGAGNQSVIATDLFYLDTVKPTANASLATNNPFSPNADTVKDDTTINITGSDTSPIVSWNLQIEDQSAVPVRNYSGVNSTTSLSEVVVWDGKDNGASTVPDGTYNYILIAQDAAGNFFVAPMRSVVVDTTKPVINSISASPLYFAPGSTGNGYKTTSFNINITDNLSNINWTHKIKDPLGAYIHEGNGSGSNSIVMAHPWDGKDELDVVQPDGLYTAEMYATDAAGNVADMNSALVNIDSTKPNVDVSSPLPDSKMVGIVDIEGTASDDAISKYELYIGLGASPVSWDKVGEGFSNVQDALLYQWDTREISEDDNYTLKLLVTDLANNTKEENVIVSIENKMLMASIDYPAVDEIISGIYPVVGTATNTNLTSFKSYKVEAQLQNVAEPKWIGVGGDSIPVADATLAMFNTALAKANGEFILRVTAYDKAGNVVISTRRIYIDNAPPTYGVISPADKSIVSGTDSEKIVVTDVYDSIAGMYDGSASVEMTINDEPVSANYDSGTNTLTYEPVGGFVDGKYSVTMNLIDKNGNKLPATKNWSFDVDNTMPQGDITLPVDGSTIKGSVPIIGTVNDMYLTTYKLEHKLASASVYTSISAPAGYAGSGTKPVLNGTLSVWQTPIIDGLYDLRLSVNDKSGKVTYVTKQYTVEQASTPPLTDTAEITSPDGSSPLSKTVAIKGTATLATSGFDKYVVTQYRTYPTQSGSPAQVVSSTIPVTSGTLANWDTTGKNGTYELRVNVYEKSNTTPIAQSPIVTVNIDNGIPQLPKTSPSPANGSYTGNSMPVISVGGIRDPEPISGKLTATGINNSTIEMRLDGQTVAATYNPVTSIVSYQPPAPLANGRHAVTLRVKDVAGNTMTPIIKWAFNVDSGGITAEISRPYPNEKIKGTFAIRGKAYSKNIASYEVQYYQIHDPKSNTTPQWKRLTFSKVPIKNTATLYKWKTTDNAWIKLRLIVKDKAGNTVTTAPVLCQVDNKAPTIDIPYPAANAFARTPDGATNGVSVKVPVADALDKWYKAGTGISRTRTIFKLNDTRYPTVFDDSDNTVNYAPDGGLADNTYNASLTIYDELGNKATKNWIFTVDNTAPSASIVSPERSSTVSASVPVNGIAYDKNIASYLLEYKLTFVDQWTKVALVKNKSVTGPGTLATLALPPLDEQYEFRLTATDKAGNATIYPDISDPYIFKVNRAASTLYSEGVSFVSPNDGSVFSGKAAATILPIIGDAKDPSFNKYVVSQRLLPGGTPANIVQSATPVDRGTLANWDITGRNGEYELKLEVYKNPGPVLATAAITKTIKIDSTPPTIKPTFSPAINAFVKDARQPITISYTENFDMNPDKFKVYIDGFLIPLDGANSSYDSPSKTFVYTPQEDYGDGLHTVSIYGEDIAGHSVSSSKLWQFTVDSNSILAPTLPTVSISSPVENGFGAGAISINGTAFDPNIASYKLEYTTDILNPDPAWTLIGTVSSKSVISGSLFKWTTTLLANAQYKIKLTLTDKAANTLTDETTFTLDNTLPTALITSPATTNVIKGTQDIIGTASDANFDFYKVEYQRTGSAVWNQISVADPTQQVIGGILASWDTTSVQDGVYTIKVTSKDKAGSTTIATVTTIKVDNTAPTVTISNPANNGWVKSSVSIIGSQVDTNMLIRDLIAQEIDINGDPLGGPIAISSGASSIQPGNTLGTWNTSSIPSGRFKLIASAQDKAGSTSSYEITVNVDNVLPSASITSPAASEIISGSYNISGDALDTNISSYKVEYRIGTGTPVLITNNTNPPTSGISGGILASWDTSLLDQTKTYTIIHTVFDKSGNQKKTEQTGIKVDNTAPTALISAPTSGYNLIPTTAISGTAQDTNIANWKIEYADEAAPNTWFDAVAILPTLNPGTTNKVATLLINWDTNALAPATYKIRLTVTDIVGIQSQAVMTGLVKL